MPRLIRYKVSTGQMKAVVETPYEANAEAVALIALNAERPAKLGVLTEVSGGQYSGDEATYFSTESLCRKLGRWAEQGDQQP